MPDSILEYNPFTLKTLLWYECANGQDPSAWLLRTRATRPSTPVNSVGLLGSTGEAGFVLMHSSPECAQRSLFLSIQSSVLRCDLQNFVKMISANFTPSHF